MSLHAHMYMYVHYRSKMSTLLPYPTLLYPTFPCNLEVNVGWGRSVDAFFDSYCTCMITVEGVWIKNVSG